MVSREGDMQLTLDLTFTPAPPVKMIFKNTTWLDAGWAAGCLGFTKKVEISQSLSDALRPFHAEDEANTISNSMTRSGWRITIWCWTSDRPFPSPSISCVTTKTLEQ